jgi:MFS family permease
VAAMTNATAQETPRLSMTQVLLCGALIVTLSMGIRHGFGLWLQPITMERGWTRETFAFAMAVQNLAFGLAGPFAGAVADRFGAFRVIVAGGVLYALGLAAMALAATGLNFMLGAGVLLGVAQSACTYAVVFGVIARNVAPEKRSWAMGVAAAAGSFGQFLMVPVETLLIGWVGWQQALLLLAAASLLMLPLALGLRERAPAGAAAGAPQQSILGAIREAMGYRSFQLLMAGYFVCGFQLQFIGVHMPSYLKDKGLGIEVATIALMLIGLFNVFGTYGAGMLGERMAKRHILAGIYGARALAIVAFIAAPPTPMGVYVFAAAVCCGCPPCRRRTPSWRKSSACSTCRCSAASSS